MQTVRPGQPFELSYTENGGPAQWQVTLDSIACGGPTIFEQKILSAYYSDEGQPLTIPQPDPGMQFCLVKFNVTNEGNSNQPWSASDATVNVGMKAYSDQGSGPGSDAESAYMQNAQPHGQTSDFGINPGVSGVSWAVFEIPAGAHATSVSVPNGTSLQELGGVQQVLVMLGS